MNNNKIKIVDDCVSLQYQNFLLQELHAPNLTWIFSEDVTIHNTEHKNPGFANMAYKDGSIVSTAYWFLYPVLLEACNKTGCSLKKLLRIRNGIYLNRDTTKPNLPHVDADSPHLVGLYYPDNFDGDTIFYTDSTGTAELTRVTPKKGRMVLFDGAIYHASSNPVHSNYRTTVNFNFLGVLP
jgi:hypothetical protein